METTLYKKDIIKILERTKTVIEPYHTDENGAKFLRKIKKMLTHLDCCVKNIDQFADTQQRIACLLYDAFKVVATGQFEDIKKSAESLQRSSDGLDDLSTIEIQGKDCQEEYVKCGFEADDYLPEYLFVSNT